MHVGNSLLNVKVMHKPGAASDPYVSIKSALVSINFSCRDLRALFSQKKLVTVKKEFNTANMSSPEFLSVVFPESEEQCESYVFVTK